MTEPFAADGASCSGLEWMSKERRKCQIPYQQDISWIDPLQKGDQKWRSRCLPPQGTSFRVCSTNGKSSAAVNSSIRAIVPHFGRFFAGIVDGWADHEQAAAHENMIGRAGVAIDCGHGCVGFKGEL